jgi:hypothetical protein
MRKSLCDDRYTGWADAASSGSGAGYRTWRGRSTTPPLVVVETTAPGERVAIAIVGAVAAVIAVAAAALGPAAGQFLTRG